MSATTTIDVSALIERQKLNGFLVRLVVVSWIITFFDGFDQNVISFAAPTIAPMYHLTRPMMGNVFSIGLVGTMLGGFLFGWIGDRWGRRPAVIIATLLFAVMTLDFALAGSYGGFLAMRLAVGIGTGGMLPLSWALNIEYAPKRWRSSIVTVVMLGYSAGISLGGPIAVWLIPRFGWQSVFVFGGVAVVARGHRADRAAAGVDPLHGGAAAGHQGDRRHSAPHRAGPRDPAQRALRDERRGQPGKQFLPAPAVRRRVALDHADAVGGLHFQLDGGVLPGDLDAAGVRGAGLLAAPRRRRPARSPRSPARSVGWR